MSSLAFDVNALQRIPLFDTIINSLHDGVLITDDEAYIKYVNSSYMRLTGVCSKDVLNKKVQDVRKGARLPEVLQTGMALLGVKRKVNDIEYIADINPIVFNDKVVGAISVVRDITEVVALSNKLRDYSHRVIELRNKVREIHRAHYHFDDIIGGSTEMAKVKERARRVADGNTPVLISGESGSGKELFAHAIHNAGPRCNSPFVPVNCAAFSPQLLSSELFGYEEGAFTGALKGGKLGLFEIAHGGSLFLDEIGDMEYELQSRLLRVLETGEFMRIGGTKPIKVDVRIISATNRNISRLIHEVKFREDLYYRLNVISLDIPPLRMRLQDIPPLVEHFLDTYNRRRKRRYTASKSTIDILHQYHYPGNVRELFNILEFAASTSETEEILPKDLPIFSRVRPQPSICRALSHTARSSEKEAITEVLKSFGKSLEGKRKAAGQLGISLATLYNKIRQYDI
ncbi:MAG: sigma 54-interacting transcriptional regulator [Syntrophales bacterium]|jgi:PAS domain S-box-containing protein|nr:sigma 54-interacting transcriptional regulator [Syntrophales bacterium]